MGKKRGGHSSASRMLVQQWQLLLAIQGSRAGIGVARLVEETGIKRATAYRYLKLLFDAGVPLHAVTVNGEKRYRFLRTTELPNLGLSALQITALHLARQELQPLAGAALVRELDNLLERLRPKEAQESLRFSPRRNGQPELLKAVDRALHYGRRARIEYRAASRDGAPTSVHIEPLLLYVAEGEPYLRAYCVERAAERTYKLTRIARFDLTEEHATYRPTKPPTEAFNHSVKAWSGEIMTVKIKLDAEVAWRAHEYPLVPGHKLETLRDGSVTVEACVADIVEARNWVLSWGGAAEALEPVELRSALRADLGKALSRYNRPGPGTVKVARENRPNAKRGVSRTVRRAGRRNGRCG